MRGPDKDDWQQEGSGVRICYLGGGPERCTASIQLTCADGSTIMASRELLVGCSTVFRNAVDADDDAGSKSCVSVEVPEDGDTMRRTLKAAHDIALVGRFTGLDIALPWSGHEDAEPEEFAEVVGVLRTAHKY